MVRIGHPPRSTVGRRVWRWVDANGPTTMLALAALAALAAR